MIHGPSRDPVNGRWLLTGVAGRGSAAVVYRAFDLLGEELVALKAISGTGGPRRSAREAKREFLDLARVRHRNVVETFELGTAEKGALPSGTSFFTMQLLDHPVLPLLPASTEGVACLAAGLLAGLDCIHAHGLVHLDIKPSNVLVDAQAQGPPRYKISDLGLARLGGGQRAGGAGTLPYAAPEVIGGGRIDRRADLYSLGVLLFEMATGSLPFDAADPAAVLEWHLTEGKPPVGSPRALTPILARLIGRMLETRPQGRLGHAREALGELLEAFPALPIGPDPLSGADPSPARGSASWPEEPHRLRAEPPASGGGPLVGRSAETGAIVKWMRGAVRSGGHLRIIGTGGCGLSRIALEVSILGRAERWSVHLARCRSGERPFAPLYRLLRETLLARCASRGGPGTLGGRRPISGREILALLGGVTFWEIEPPDPLEAAGPLASALSAFLESNPPGRPTLLVLDDFDRADAGVRSVVERLGGHRGKRVPRLLIITTERTSADARGQGGECDGPIGTDGIARNQSGGAGARPLGHEPLRVPVGILRLPPLSADASRILIEALPGLVGLDPSEAESIVRSAQGNPARLVRLGWARAEKQPSLFPSVREPRFAAPWCSIP